jgi:hypothetical protein
VKIDLYIYARNAVRQPERRLGQRVRRGGVKPVSRDAEGEESGRPGRIELLSEELSSEQVRMRKEIENRPRG